MQITPELDATSAEAPTWFGRAVDFACAMMDRWIASPIAVTIDFSWGSVDGQPIEAGAAAETITMGQISGDLFEPNALLQLQGREAAGQFPVDGFVGLSADQPWFANGKMQIQPGTLAPVSAFEHEVSEVLGRTGTGSPNGGPRGPLDLLPGSAFALPVNGAGGGDFYDWGPSVVGDTFGSATPGIPLELSRADGDVMRALGYQLGPLPHNVTLWHP